MLSGTNGLNILLREFIRLKDICIWKWLKFNLFETSSIYLSFVSFQVIYVSHLQIMQNGCNLKQNTECTWHFWKYLTILFQFITKYFIIFQVISRYRKCCLIYFNIANSYASNMECFLPGKSLFFAPIHKKLIWQPEYSNP